MLKIEHKDKAVFYQGQRAPENELKEEDDIVAGTEITIEVLNAFQQSTRQKSIREQHNLTISRSNSSVVDGTSNPSTEPSFLAKTQLGDDSEDLASKI